MVTFKVNNQEVKMEDLGSQDLSGRKLLGTAEGLDFNHCLYLAMKYGKDFANRVKGFRRAIATNGGPYAVSFYE